MFQKYVFKFEHQLIALLWFVFSNYNDFYSNACKIYPFCTLLTYQYTIPYGVKYLTGSSISKCNKGFIIWSFRLFIGYYSYKAIDDYKRGILEAISEIARSPNDPINRYYFPEKEEMQVGYNLAKYSIITTIIDCAFIYLFTFVFIFHFGKENGFGKKNQLLY